MTLPYILTLSAAADLRSIVNYTNDIWGRQKCRDYIAQIEAATLDIALGKGRYSQRDDLLPGLRVRRTGRHYIFCLSQPDQPALILAILHERMDIIARLQERLD